MLHRSLPDVPAPTDADFETAATTAAAALVENGERRQRILARLTDIAMDLAEALGRQAHARIEAATAQAARDAAADGAAAAAPAPALPNDPTIAFNRMAQTVRRCLALEAKFAAGVKADREGLTAERAERRAKCAEDHETAKNRAIIYGLHDAYAAQTPDPEYAEHVERLMADVQEHLLEADEFSDWLGRPVGESVAKLCATLGLDPDVCVRDGDAWTVRRPPTELELNLAKYFPPVGGGKGRAPQAPGWGAVASKPPDLHDAARAPP